ncbi:hypothetical protein WEH80_00570 [Actinomycetes bacterium KLBMP 9759]
MKLVEQAGGGRDFGPECGSAVAVGSSGVAQRGAGARGLLARLDGEVARRGDGLRLEGGSETAGEVAGQAQVLGVELAAGRA